MEQKQHEKNLWGDGRGLIKYTDCSHSFRKHCPVLVFKNTALIIMLGKELP